MNEGPKGVIVESIKSEDTTMVTLVVFNSAVVYRSYLPAECYVKDLCGGRGFYRLLVGNLFVSQRTKSLRPESGWLYTACSDANRVELYGHGVEPSFFVRLFTSSRFSAVYNSKARNVIDKFNHCIGGGFDAFAVISAGRQYAADLDLRDIGNWNAACNIRALHGTGNFFCLFGTGFQYGVN